MPLIERDITISWNLKVYFSQGIFEISNSTLHDVLTQGGVSPFARIAKALLVIDESLLSTDSFLGRKIESYFMHHHDSLELVCSPVAMVGGEAVKNAYFRVSEVHALIDRYHIDRHSYVIAVGGGALLDMVGLAAATAHRGVRHIRIPTTTLAQDDSGVGVKRGGASGDEVGYYFVNLHGQNSTPLDGFSKAVGKI